MNLRPSCRIVTLPTIALSALLAGLTPAVPAHAGDDHRTRAAMPPLPAYVRDCGACHVPYPSRLLPAASWQRLMQTLPRHYGSDASLDAATTAEIQAWLVANAGSGRRAAETPPEDRITRSAWFVREHREVPTGAWSRPAIKSASNCKSCHARADTGDFDEHDVRIPR